MKTRFQAAFTLIELLVVITIIGILASFALPALQNAQVAAQQTKALSNARQVVGSLRAYAADNDGKFPSTLVDATGTDSGTKVTTSNQAFRLLFPTYLTNEQVFYVPKSKWSTIKPDDKIDAVANSGATETLKLGENHWAYFPGLTDVSNSALPLVADGFTAGGPDPQYTTDEAAKGGVWKGKVAVTVHIDQSAEKLKCVGTGANCHPERVPGGNGVAKVNYFAGGTVANDPNWLRTGENDAVCPQ